MEYDVYIDVIFLLNFVMDLFIIRLVNLIMKCHSSIIRSVIAALLGSLLICILYLIPNMGILLYSFIAYIGISSAMVYVAYKPTNFIVFIKDFIGLFAITCLVGGTISFLRYSSGIQKFYNFVVEDKKLKDISLQLFLGLILITYFFLKIVINVVFSPKTVRENLHNVTIKFNEHTIDMVAYLDTGNMLYEPVKKEPVVVVEYSAIKRAIEHQYQLVIEEYFMENALNMELITKKCLYNIKMIPYNSVGKKNGMLIAMKCEKLFINDIDKSYEDVIMALVEAPLSTSGEYKMLLHPQLLNN